MAQKNTFQFSIREYLPSDQPVVMSLFTDGVREHVYLAFFKAMSDPDHVGVALSIAMAGYVLGGSSYLQALLFLAAWAGLIYYCCHEIYEGYLTRRLASDMAAVHATYLENPDNGLWVAVAADPDADARVVGTVAVTGRRPEEEAERFDDCNGGVMADFPPDDAEGGHGELSLLVVAFPWRGRGLGAQLMGRALDFCKERGYGRLVADVSSPQTSAVSLYRKRGLVQTASHSNTHANRWFSKLARINVLQMEKSI